MSEHTITIASDTNISYVTELVGLWITNLGLPWEVLQSTSNSSSAAEFPDSFRNGKGTLRIEVLYLTGSEQMTLDSPDEDASTNLYLAELKEIAQKGSVDCFLLFPSSYESAPWLHDLDNYLSTNNVELGFHLLTPSFVSRTCGVAPGKFFDADRSQAALVASQASEIAIATAVVRYSYNMLIGPRKVVVVDCDETLWRGYCGEDGAHEVLPDTSCLALQRFLKGLSERGFLLCLCSKNDEDSVKAVFSHHTEMPLNLSHFVRAKINWFDKAVNLQSISQELNIGLEDFIFIDDDELECSRVADLCPNVLVVRWSNDTSALSILDRLWALDSFSLTEEDRRRAQFYKDVRPSSAELASTPSASKPALAKREIFTRLTALEEGHLDRVAQLSLRANQFNSTLKRRIKNDYRALLLSSDYRCYCISVHDAYGDYGIVGSVILNIEKDWTVDEFILSCRVLGKEIDEQVIEQLLSIASGGGGDHLLFYYVESGRNSRVRELFEWASGDCGVDGEFCVTAASFRAAGSRDEGGAKHQVISTNDDVSRRPVSARSLLEIAHVTGSRELIVRALNPQSTLKNSQSVDQEPDRIGIQKFLVKIWSKLLDRDVISSEDDFFTLGGDSLVAMQTIARVKTTFGVVISVDEFFVESPTIASITDAIIAGSRSVNEKGDTSAAVGFLYEQSV